MENRICNECKREFIPSSGHLKCPICRDKSKMKPCPECGVLIYRRSRLCRTCTGKKVAGTIVIRDEYSGFRTFITRAKRRNKLVNLSVSDVLDVWKRQYGKCAYSGVDLKLPSYKKKNDSIHTASLDRIDSSLPYTKDNIQFVSISINLMKAELTHNQTVELCKIIANHWTSPTT